MKIKSSYCFNRIDYSGFPNGIHFKFGVVSPGLIYKWVYPIEFSIKFKNKSYAVSLLFYENNIDPVDENGYPLFKGLVNEED